MELDHSETIEEGFVPNRVVPSTTYPRRTAATSTVKTVVHVVKPTSDGGYSDGDLFTAAFTRITHSVPICIAWMCIICILIYRAGSLDTYIRYGEGISEKNYERFYGEERRRLREDCGVFTEHLLYALYVRSFNQSIVPNTQPVTLGDLKGSLIECAELDKIRSEKPPDPTRVVWLGSYIDTPLAHRSLLVLAFLSAIFSDFMWNVPMTYIQNYVQDPSAKILFSYFEVMWTSVGAVVYTRFSAFLELGISFVQADFFVAALLGSTLFRVAITHMFMMPRVTTPVGLSSNELEMVRNILRRSSMNIATSEGPLVQSEIDQLRQIIGDSSIRPRLGLGSRLGSFMRHN